MPCSTHARAHKPCPRSITETVLRAFPFFLSPRLLREATFYVTRLYVRTIDRIVAFTQRLPLFQHLFASCHLPLPRRKNGNNFFSKSRTWRFHAREGEQALDPYLSSHVCRYLTGQDKYLPHDFHDSWYPDSVQFDNCRVSRSRIHIARGEEGGKEWSAFCAFIVAAARIHGGIVLPRFFRPGQKSAAAFSLCTLRANLDSARDHRLHTVSKRFEKPRR